MLNEGICGILKYNGDIKNLILGDGTYFNVNSKEIQYSTMFGEVESLVGFEKDKIKEYEADSSYVDNAKNFLISNPILQAIIFCEDNIIICVTDILFFSGYIYDNGETTMYKDVVESFTYDDEESAMLIEQDWRLQ